MKRAIIITAAMLAIQCAVLQTAQAHFIWLLQTPEKASHKIDIYFSEAAEPDNPELLERLTGLEVWRLQENNKPAKLTLKKGADSLQSASPRAEGIEPLFVGKHDYGVISRGGKTFRLRYYAKAGPSLTNAAWTKVKSQEQLQLDIVPTKTADGKLKLTVTFQGKPVAGAEVKGYGPELEEFEAVTDKAGVVMVADVRPGEYGFRARHVEDVAGKVDDKEYNDVRHYSTVTFEAEEAQPKTVSTISDRLPVIPKCVTSFGGAIADGYLYIYGGHTGAAHSYSYEEQDHTLQRVKLDPPSDWETVAEGPHLQGLALVANQGKLYRLGGFTAKNKEGEDKDLWSQNYAAQFDPATKKWTDLPPLPEPRSSFDAAVMDDTIYVVGGWALRGEDESQWYKTAWKLDLTAKPLKWEAIPAPPFERRALAVAAHEGKIYALGGMQKEGGPTRNVDVFHTKTQKWSQLEPIHGERMAGFGCSAFATGGRLYVSTLEGQLQRLAEDGQHWEVMGELPNARFFHRMLPYSDDSLLMVGGANMGIGKFEEVEIVPVKK